MKPEQLIEYFDRISEAPDAVARLRRFILDLAVRGKLVEQDPNDEPAVELLKRIQVEKARLVKEGKLKKATLAVSAESIKAPYDLPGTWAWSRLGDIAQYGLPEKVDSNKSISPDTWVLDLEDIEKDTSRLIERMPSSVRPFRSTKTIFKCGDVLFGKLRPYLNKVLVADQDGVCTTEIIPIRGYCGLVSEYVKLVLKSPLTMARVDRLMYGMKMPRLGTGDAISLDFPLPPLAEQHRIVAKVDELMALCDQLEAAKNEREAQRDRLVAASLHRIGTAPAAADEVATDAQNVTLLRDAAHFHLNHLPRLTTRPEHIKQLRQTILDLAVRGRLVVQDPNDEPARKLLSRISEERANLTKGRKSLNGRLDAGFMEFSAEEIPFALPEGWAWTRMQDVARHNQSITYGILKPVWVENGIPTVRVTEMKTGTIDVASLPRCDPARASKFTKTTLAVGDLLISKDGTIGKTAFVPEGLEGGNITQHVIRFPICDSLDRFFVRMCIDAPYCQRWLSGETKGVALQGVNVGDFRRMPLPIPPIAEQQRIVAKVDELMALCDQLDAQLTTTQTDSRRLLEAVLHEALSPIHEEVA